MQLQLDQVEPGRLLGDRVLDLQPGVDLHEPEVAGLGVDQELDGARVAVARRFGDAHGGSPDRVLAWAASSTVDADSSITFWLRRCTEQSRTPTAHVAP